VALLFFENRFTLFGKRSKTGQNTLKVFCPGATMLKKAGKSFKKSLPLTGKQRGSKSIRPIFHLQTALGR